MDASLFCVLYAACIVNKGASDGDGDGEDGGGDGDGGYRWVD